LLIYALVADTHLNSINTYIVEFRSKRSRQEFFEVFKELLVPRLHFQKMVATLVKMSGPENPPFLVSLAQALANGYITGVGDLPLLQLFKSLLKKILKLNGHLNAEGHFQVAQMLEHYATLARALPKKMAFFKSADEVSRYAIKAMQRATLAHELAGVELESLILQMQNLKEPLSENEKARLEHKVEVVKNRLEQLERLIWRIEGLQGHEMVIAPRSNEGAAREFLLALQTYIRQSQWSDSVVLKFFKALNTNVGLPKIAQEHLALIKRASDGKNSFEHSLAAIEKLSQAALDDPLREHTAFEHIYLTKILNPQQRLYHVTRPISPKL
jgi:hypothetical protein